VLAGCAGANAAGLAFGLVQGCLPRGKAADALAALARFPHRQSRAASLVAGAGLNDLNSIHTGEAAPPAGLRIGPVGRRVRGVRNPCLCAVATLASNFFPESEQFCTDCPCEWVQPPQLRKWRHKAS